MPNRKRKRSGNGRATIPKTGKCILHVPSSSDHGPFTNLSNVKGTPIQKLQYLHDIRDRRYRQPHGSPFRMQSACDQIPATLPDDLESVGYHRLCYQLFTKNLDRLGDETESGTSTTLQRSTRKKHTGPLFPPECIFCKKPEIKGRGRKTERTETFSSWKNKKNAWEKNRITSFRNGSN